MDDDFPNLLDVPGPVRAADAAWVARLFAPLRGRIGFNVTNLKQPGPPACVDLRLDPENALLSGDLFAKTDRSGWMLSWRSDAIYMPPSEGPDLGWDFAAVCSLWFAESEPQRHRAKLFLTARFPVDDPTRPHEHAAAGATTSGPDATRGAGEPRPENRGLPAAAFRLAVIDPADNPAGPAAGLAGKPYEYAIDPASLPQHSPCFRELRLFFDVDPRLKQGAPAQILIGQAVDQVIGIGAYSGRGRIARTLQSEGLAASPTRTDLDAESLAAVTSTAKTAHEVFSIVQQNASRQKDNALTVYLSSHEDAEGERDLTPLGVALGLDRFPKRFGSGRAAIVFPNEIAKSLLRQRPGRRRGLAEEDLDDLAFRIEFTILHELGHLLNLPHPWQRDAFDLCQLDSEPHGVTWMNYGSLFPLGAVTDFALRRIADERDRRETRDRLAQANLGAADAPLRKASFTRQERLHLFHARHDLIAPRGRTFADSTRDELRLQSPPPSLARLVLSIDGADAKDPETGMPTARLTAFIGSDDHVKFQLPTGIVRYRLPANPGSDNPQANLPFRFSAGSLFWLFREEKPVEWTNAAPRRQACYMPDYSVLLPRIARPSPNLGAILVEDGSRAFWEFVAPLPILSSEFLCLTFPGSLSFTTQMVFVPPGKPPVFSNQIALIYQGIGEGSPFGPVTSSIVELLQDGALPSFSETSLYFRRAEADFLTSAPDIMALIDSREVRDAALDMPDRLAWLQRLIAFIEARRLLDKGSFNQKDGPPLRYLTSAIDAETRGLILRQADALRSREYIAAGAELLRQALGET